MAYLDLLLSSFKEHRGMSVEDQSTIKDCHVRMHESYQKGQNGEK